VNLKFYHSYEFVIIFLKNAAKFTSDFNIYPARCAERLYLMRSALFGNLKYTHDIFSISKRI